MLKVFVLCALLAVGRGHTIHDDIDNTKASSNDLQELKSAVVAISDRLDQWDSFFMHKFEPRMLGAVTLLANLDSNIRNLQERAHVWDTFQLHVAAWNDQIKSLDHKVNIINEGYEKLLSLDSKLHSVLKPEGTIHAIELQLIEFGDKLESLSHAMAKETPAPIVSEFAGRGVLHTVKLLERKLDRLQVAVDRLSQQAKYRDIEFAEELTSEKMTIKCSTPPVLENVLKDVSAKVDAIFDRSDLGDTEVELVPEVQARHLDKACKRLVAPYKKLLTGVEYIKSVMQDLVELDPPSNEKALNLRARRKLNALTQIEDTLEDIEKSISNLGRDQNRNVNENEKILRRIERKLDGLAREEDEEDELVVKLVNRVEKNLRKAILEIDDDDDSDEKKGKKNKNKNDSDDSDDDDSDDEDNRRKSRRRGDDSDDDSDDDDTRERKGRKHRKGDDNDSDDSDDDESDEKKEGKRHRGKKGSKSRTNDDDSDEDDTREKKGGKRRKGDDSDSDDNDSDDDDTREKKGGKGRKDDNDSDDNDSDDDDTREKKGGKRRKDDNDSDDNDSDDDDTREKKGGKRRKDDNDSDDDDTREKKGGKRRKDDDNDSDDNDSDDSKEQKGGNKSRDNDSDDDDDDSKENLKERVAVVEAKSPSETKASSGASSVSETLSSFFHIRPADMRQ